MEANTIYHLGIGVSLLSVSVAVLKQGWNGKKNNNNYVRRPECHAAQEGIKGKIEDLRSHIDTRFEDLKDTINGRLGIRK